jgi:hypothetical protein
VNLIPLGNSSLLMKGDCVLMRLLWKAGLVVVVSAALFATACSDDDSEDSSSGGQGPQTVQVRAVDYAFQNLPASLSVGSKVTLTNESQRELHELVAIALPASETRSVATLLQLPEEQLEGIVTGEPEMVLIAPPGAPGMAVVGDGTFTRAGRYAIVCFIPTGADPQAYLAAAQQSSDGPPQVAGGPPHVAQGMFAEVIVR